MMGIENAEVQRKFAYLSVTITVRCLNSISALPLLFVGFEGNIQQ